jgi:hypothetical protein
MGYPNFQHHPDGLIFVRKSVSEIYQDTIANFRADLGSSYIGLPDGYIGRYYEPGKNHYLTTGDSAVPQGLSWSEGDTYITAYDKLITSKFAREAAANTAKNGTTG